MKKIISIFFCFGFSSLPAFAETKLEIVTQMLPAVCGDFSASGSGQSLKIEGDAEVKLAGLLKKLTELGIEGATTFSSDEYVGVLRSEVGRQLDSVRACRERVWQDMSPLLINDTASGNSINSTGDNNTSVIGSGNTISN